LRGNASKGEKNDAAHECAVMGKSNMKINIELKLLLIVLSSVILSQALIIFSFAGFSIAFTLKTTLISAGISMCIIFFAVYFLLCRPMKIHLRNFQQTEKTLERFIRRNELILEAAGEGILGLDAEGRVIFVNPSAAKMLGYEVEELIGEIHHDKVHHTREIGVPYPDENCPIHATYTQGTTGHGNDEIFRKKDGTSIPIEYMSTPMIEKGEVIGAVVTFRDLTERKRELQEIEDKQCHLEYLWTSQKQAEVAQRASEKRYLAFFNDSRDAIYITTADGKCLEINQSALDLLGYPKAEICRMAVKELFLSLDEYNGFKQIIDQKGSIKDYETKLLRKDGKEIDCLITSTMQTDEDGTISGYHGIIHDITERKKLEQQLLQAQKMEAVGRLAGGIAHDFNNILTAIIGYGNLLKIDIKEDDPLNNYATQILNSAERAANLTRALLTFSRKQIISPKPVNINDVIKGIGRLLSRLIGEDIDLSTPLTDKDLTIMADTTQIEQVLMNLATNARDAMPNGGTLVISTDMITFDNEYLRAHGYGRLGNFALISVEDTGCGIDEKIKERIFEPFFTTKEIGKGTGLGLAMVYGIIKQHEGYINVYSDADKGTTFKIYLPLIKSRFEEPGQIDAGPVSGGTETILIAEDDAQVRVLTKKILEKAGYHVIEAADGVAAMNLFRANQDKIQLLILDVIMPKKNGKECYDEIRKSTPDIKTIFTSGYTANIIHKKGILEEGIDLILKPVSPNQLLRKVREVLDR
jgi:PAS domain S-box-containing protein